MKLFGALLVLATLSVGSASNSNSLKNVDGTVVLKGDDLVLNLNKV